jgi:hypothetical protein
LATDVLRWWAVRGEPKSVAETRRTRPDVPAPVTILDLVELFARALDEGPYVSRLNR